MASGDVTAQLPRGSVTFLLTDIEGSTRLFQSLGDAYPELLERHDALLRDAVESHGGQVVKTIGDSTFAAFSGAASAARAAAAALQSLAQETPSEVEQRLRVRMGLHTGLAIPRRGDYISLAVHQAARVASAANGGQILCSMATASELSGATSDGLTLESRGSFRLKDFDDAEPLYELVVEGVERTGLPPRARPAARDNIPVETTSFVGRAADIAALDQLLRAQRLVTIVGGAGFGKTRLAIETARHVASEGERATGGVWFVALAGVTEPGAVPGAVADALGVGVAAEADPVDALVNHFGQDGALLVLDNCEHVSAASAALAQRLVGASLGIRVLATSQRPLGLRTEQVYRLAPLDLPPQGLKDPEEASSYAAVALLAARVASADHRFTLDRTNAAVMVEICNGLDGIPLALELAAARFSLLDAAQVAARLHDRFGLLRSRDDRPERHQTLRAAVDWSYEQLEEPAQVLLRRLSVFPGSFAVDAAVRVGGWKPLDEDDVLDLLSRLVEHSFVHRQVADGATRFALLSTIRLYAAAELDRAGETGAAWAAVTSWLIGVVAGIARHERSRLTRAEEELATIEATLATAPPDAGDLGGLGEAAVVLCRTRGRLLDGIRIGAATLARLGRRDPGVGGLLCELGNIHIEIGDPSTARALADEIIAGDTSAAFPPGLLGRALRLRGRAALLTGQLDEARDHLAAALAVADSDRRRWEILTDLGIVEAESDNLAAAGAHLNGAMTLARVQGDPWSIGVSLDNLAELATRNGDDASALAFGKEALTLNMELGAEHGLAATLSSIASIAARGGRDGDAVALAAGASHLFDTTGFRMYGSDAGQFEATVLELEARLGSARFRELWRTGATQATTHLVDLALGLAL